MATAALCMLCALSASGGASDCVATSGNGSLTIGFDRNGSLSVCRWPGSTGPNQITYSGETSANRGGMWGIPREGGIDWLPEKFADDANVTRAESGVPIVSVLYKSIGAVGTAFVCKDVDVAVFRLQFDKMPASNTAIWYSEFSPCTSTMRALPSSELLFPARRDMVTFAQYDTVYHGRPNAPSSSMWDDAESWLAGGDAPDWFTKGEGAWIACAADAKLPGVACGTENGDGSAIALAESAAWNTHMKSVGACASAVAVPIDPGTRAATIYVAFGETRAEADAKLSTARQHGYQALFDAARVGWKERAQFGAWPVGVSDDVMGLKERAVVTLLMLADTKTGAVARGPLSQPATCVAMPRDVAWITCALDRAGQTETASNLLKFYARCVRTSDAPGAPAGSLPAMLYANGEEAAPHTMLDVEAPAWLLWSIWQHDAQVPEQQREGYRAELHKSVESAGDYLSNWSRAVRDTPAFSYDYARKRDTHSLETIAVVYAGLRAADAFARAGGHEKPDWAARLIEVEDYLRFNALDPSTNFKIEAPLTLWMTDIVGAGDPRWQNAVQTATQNMQEYANTDTESLETLAQLAMLLRGQREKLDDLEPLVLPATKKALDANPCDSYYAALAVVAILTVFGP